MAVTSYPIKKIAGGKGPFYDYEFKGLSTDTKPTKDIPVNSLFWELDTNKFYYCSQEAVEPVVEKTVLLDTTIAEWETIEEGRYRSMNDSLVTIPSSDMPADSLNVKVNGQKYVLPKIGGFLAYGEVEQGLPSFENYPVAIMPNTDGTDVIGIEVYSPNEDEMAISVYFETTTQEGSDAVWTELGTSSEGGGDLNTVTATIVNNSESTKSYAFYGYDFINGSLPGSPILALQVKNGEYYAGTYSNEVSAGETDTAEIVMLSDAFYFDANQNAQVTGDATIAWDDAVESYIVTATDDFTLTYE